MESAIKEITTNGITILFIEVPEYATNFKIANYPLLDTVLEYEFTNGEAPELRCIPSGQYEILGKSTESIHEVLGISKEEYLSLLEANGIVDRNPYNKPSDLPYTYNGYEEFYQQAQSKVKHYLVLKRIK